MGAHACWSAAGLAAQRAPRPRSGQAAPRPGRDARAAYQYPSVVFLATRRTRRSRRQAVRVSRHRYRARLERTAPAAEARPGSTPAALTRLRKSAFTSRASPEARGSSARRAGAPAHQNSTRSMRPVVRPGGGPMRFMPARALGVARLAGTSSRHRRSAAMRADMALRSGQRWVVARWSALGDRFDIVSSPPVAVLTHFPGICQSR